MSQTQSDVWILWGSVIHSYCIWIFWDQCFKLSLLCGSSRISWCYVDSLESVSQACVLYGSPGISVKAHVLCGWVLWGSVTHSHCIWIFLDQCLRLSILCGSSRISVSDLCARQILWGQSLRLIFCVDPLGSVFQAYVLWGSFVISVSGPVCYVDLLGSEVRL